jgi:RND family efflux transporter MFP subunit
MSLQKKIIIAVSSIILISGLAIGAYFLFSKNSTAKYNFATVNKGNIAEEINLNGNVKAAENVQLAFEKSGKIAQANFKVGDKIKTGQLIASLISSDLTAQLAQAQAAYDAQVAILKNLQAGARAEDIQISATSVQNAQDSLTNTKNKADNDLNTLYGKSSDILNDAYNKSFDALYNKTDGIFSNPLSDRPTLIPQINDSALKNDLETERPSINQELTSMKNEIDNLDSNQTNIEDILTKAIAHLENVRDYLNKLNNAMNFVMISSTMTTTQISSFKTNLNTGITNLNSTISAINNQQKAFATQKITNQNSITLAENNLALAQKQLSLKQAGATTEQIAAQQAAVNQASAAIQNIRAQLSKSALISPIDGTISQQDAKIGEIASMNIPLISIISDAKFQIETKVAEADIEKIKVGQTSDITLDADSSQRIFQAKVILIDPAKTIANGSATYKVTLEFTKEDPLIKDGLTANLKIVIEQKNDVLLIPTSSIIKQYDKIIVLKNNSSSDVEQTYITIGVSQNGLTEVLSGLNQGDQIATFGKN